MKTAKEIHDLIDQIFTADKTSGDLGQLLSQLKDETNEIYQEIGKRDLAVDSHIKELDELKARNSRLVEHNGELLMRIPVKQEDQQKEEQQQESTIDWNEFE